MTRSKAVIIVSIVALIFAGLASWAVYNYLQTVKKPAAAVPGETVVVAAADVPIGAKLDATHLKTVKWPKESIPQGSFSDVNAPLGRVVVRPLTAGDAVTEAKLIPKEGAPGAGIMTYIVPQGHRAVTVAVNEVAGVAGFLAPHNRVDVVVTTVPPGTTEPISKIVLQNVPILAIGQIIEQKEGKPVVVPTVTLDLTPEDSEKLVLAASKGSLQLLLRHVVDTATVESRGATISKVLGTVERPAVKVRVVEKRVPVAAKPAPVKQAPPPYSVEVIKGMNRGTREFAPEKE